ncbi:glycosyltransferase [Fulvivirgaceae bacterium BMA10]|uniref:Glycosyltransferase n=1 Tax=Splendidivirga corallicola TaxID=3051826 RepID=A0ABT8KKT0_9BACT|nr:glycosyltransferase [Fulvivirgaceae bacterium BMA10]
MEGKKIIVVGQQPWDIDIGSNAKNIALEFAKHNQVLYVNAPLDRFTRFRRPRDPKVHKRILINKGKSPDLIKVEENLWNLYPRMMAESVNWIRSHGLFKLFNKVNNRRFAKCISDAAERLGFDDFLLFNDSLMFKAFHLKELLKPSKYVYYTRDYLIVQPYFKRHGERLEGELMHKADLVVANSTYLKEYGEQFNKNSYYIGQGCELEIFKESEQKHAPEDLQNIKGPIIGYVGFLTSMRLDIDLLVHFAKNRLDLNLVLVGPEDENFQESELHNLTNVYFLGAKKPNELPGYINSFDVCVNPQIVNPLTIGNYPRKIDEYLAMGKPVVATKTKAMEVFDGYTYLSTSKEDFVSSIDQALRENNAEKAKMRKEFAASHTWENSVKEIYKAVKLAG